MHEALAKPRCALRIAVIGRRRFAKKEPAASLKAGHARKAMELLWPEVFLAMRTELEQHYLIGDVAVRMTDFFSNEKPQLSILTSLAAGGDQIGARTALEAAKNGCSAESVD
jgi:hypothetical protein